MTCRKARPLLALHAGDDLGPRRARAVRSHLEACPECRRELEALRAALAELKAEAGREEVPQWGAGEWRALMDRVVGEARDGRSAERGPAWRLPRPRGAAAAALGAFAGLAALALLVLRPPSGPEGTALADRAAGEQDVVSLTMVSQETGLQVVWFFDKNFDYKGERE
jgi:anti-sigma factor RsiW